MPGVLPRTPCWFFEIGRKQRDLSGTWIWKISVYPGPCHFADSFPYPSR